jgi:N-acetyl-alpha-D-muramate 1-phosphate uridylyltransferase
MVTAALLAGGLATRLRPITEHIPKALVEVAGKPFIDHQLDLLRQNGIRRVVLCVGYLGEQLQAHLGDGRAFGMELHYSFDGPTLLGTGGALRQAAALLGEQFWVLYGDSYMDIEYQHIFDTFQESGACALMTVLKNGNRWDRSNVIFRNGILERYDKRHQTPDMEFIDYGAALLTQTVLQRIPANEPYDLADLYTDMVAKREMIGVQVTQRFYEIGSPSGLAETHAYLISRATNEQTEHSYEPYP